MAAHPEFNGYWAKDWDKSDPDQPQIDLIEAGFLVRQGAKAVRGVDIKVVPEEYLQFSAVTVVPFFKVSEKYPFSGEVVKLKRRDLRSGAHKGSVKWINGGKEIKVSFSFEGDVPGTGEDVFKLVAPDELHVTTTLKVDKGEIASTKVYRKKK